MAKKQDNSRAIASANTGPYVPPCARISVTDAFGRKATIETQPLTTAMLMVADQWSVKDAQDAIDKGITSVSYLGLDQLRLCYTGYSGDAWTCAPILEEVTVMGDKLSIPTRSWFLAQAGGIVNELIQQVITINRITSKENSKIDFT